MEVINTIGRRKTAIARLYMEPGKGTVTINKKKLEDYFPTEVLQTIALQALTLVNANGNFDVKVNVVGGGLKGQAEAVRLATARALCEADPEFRPSLKKEGFLTRDPRMVERKKYGHRKARRSFQFSKR
jgi:small subunit ribosomal protein S9